MTCLLSNAIVKSVQSQKQTYVNNFFCYIRFSKKKDNQVKSLHLASKNLALAFRYGKAKHYSPDTWYYMMSGPYPQANNATLSTKKKCNKNVSSKNWLVVLTLTCTKHKVHRTSRSKCTEKYPSRNYMCAVCTRSCLPEYSSRVHRLC